MLMESRRQAMLVRQQEMAALEARLAAAVNSKRSQLQQHMDEGMDPELLQEEAISSVVQHLSPFGLNRNLPWQIYATRPKRFARPPGAVAESAAAADAALLGMGSGYNGEPSFYGFGEDGYDGGDSAVPRGPQRAVLRSVYDKPTRPRKGGSRTTRLRDNYGMLPPVRGAEPAGMPGEVRDAWPSPRGGAGAQAVNAARALSPRVMAPVGAYY